MLNDLADFDLLDVAVQKMLLLLCIIIEVYRTNFPCLAFLPVTPTLLLAQ